MNYRFRIFQGSDQQWYITIEHVNVQCLYTSEGYTHKASAIETLENFIRGVRTVDPYRGFDEIVAMHSTSDAEVQP